MADYMQTYINNDMSKLNAVLQTLVTNGIVGAVDYDSSGAYAVFKIYADAAKTKEVFRITQAAGYNASYRKYTFTATASDGTVLSTTGNVPANVGGYNILYGYATSNGILVSIGNVIDSGSTTSSMRLWICATKNQNGDPVFIWVNEPFSSGVSTMQILTNMNTEYIVASTDVAPLGTVSRVAPVVRNQVQIAPFVSCSGAGDVSYTPDAGRVLAGGMNSFIYDAVAHEITFDGATWLTNGYWALKVGAAS